MKEHSEKPQPAHASVRIDKWLWAARFYKTRSLAAEAVDGGKVDVNGERVKRSKGVTAGDTITVRGGTYATTVTVRALAEKRGSATDAARLYEETAASSRAREIVRAQLSSLPRREPGEGKPSKKERRQLDRLRDGWR